MENKFVTPMKNRAIGLIIVGAQNSNWNADFSGNPRQIHDDFVGSPFSLKFCIKDFWRQLGEAVFYMKSYKLIQENKEKKKNKKVNEKNKDNAVTDTTETAIDIAEGALYLVPNNLEERLVAIFGKREYKSTVELIQDMFTCIDATCFGFTVPLEKLNPHVTGAIQFNMGINQYKEAEMLRMEVLSPFQNSKKEENKQSTVGSRTIISEGHFVYDFVVTPWNYDDLKDKIKDLSGFTREHYELFKTASLSGVSNYHSVAKTGCYNEFGLFVELNEGSLRNLVNLNEVVKITKSGFKTAIDLTVVTNQLKEIKEDIKSIEMYYNKHITEVIGLTKNDFENLEEKNILSSKKIEDL